MILRKKRIAKVPFYERVLNEQGQHPLSDREACIEFLVYFFDDIRPDAKKGTNNAELNLLKCVQFLESHPSLVEMVKQAILLPLSQGDLKATFAESGIPGGNGFWKELGERWKHKLVPPLQDKDDFLYVVNRVFYKEDDWLWVAEIKRSSWVHFFELPNFTLQATDQTLREHLMEALMLLSYRVANNGLDKDIAKFVSQQEQSTNPFVLQNQILYDLQNNAADSVFVRREVAVKLRICLQEALDEVAYIRENQDTKGTSVKQGYDLFILSHRINRMLLLIDVLDNDETFDMGQFVDLFKLVVRNENRKGSVREIISQGLGYLAYQIAEQKGHKGGKYITHSRKEYMGMIWSAMWGGFIVCFVAVFKNLLGRLHYAPFWQGFWYSVNYSFGFLAIDLSGSTLATKQPAFTANAVASSLDTKKNAGSVNLNNLAVTVAKVMRSQTASFIGNLIIVFPGTYLLAILYHKIFSEKIVSGLNAVHLLQEQHPFQSLSLLYACNTGFFLFLSGIIAGYVQNRVQFGRLGDRLGGGNWWSHFIEKNAGSLAGNISLGFFLGMASSLGKIFGIPFDIRHITISAGNMAIGVYGLGFQNIPFKYLLTVFLGVLSIGFVNFLVSFSLSFIVAIKSRGIRLRQYPELIGLVLKYFYKRPLSFFFPPKGAGLSRFI
ncbi:MAG: hypothetical protein QM727_12360 [Niabella sp.]